MDSMDSMDSMDMENSKMHQYVNSMRNEFRIIRREQDPSFVNKVIFATALINKDMRPLLIMLRHNPDLLEAKYGKTQQSLIEYCCTHCGLGHVAVALFNNYPTTMDISMYSQLLKNYPDSNVIEIIKRLNIYDQSEVVMCLIDLLHYKSFNNYKSIKMCIESDLPFDLPYLKMCIKNKIPHITAALTRLEPRRKSIINMYPMHIAAAVYSTYFGDSCIRVLTDFGYDINQLDAEGYPAIMRLPFIFRAYGINEMISNGARLDIMSNEDKITLFHNATDEGISEERYRFLLEASSGINLSPVLFTAVCKKAINVIPLLFEYASNGLQTLTEVEWNKLLNLLTKTKDRSIEYFDTGWIGDDESVDYFRIVGMLFEHFGYISGDIEFELVQDLKFSFDILNPVESFADVICAIRTEYDKYDSQQKTVYDILMKYFDRPSVHSPISLENMCIQHIKRRKTKYDECGWPPSEWPELIRHKLPKHWDAYC